MSSTAELISLANELGEALNGNSVENVPGALTQLAEILAGETDVEVIATAVGALGLAFDFQAVQIILDHVRIDHPEADVRLAVAQSLPGGVDADGPVGAAVIEALITLTRDEETDVRDWACFGLGQMNAASPAAKDALAARLDDADDDTRCEALLALAQAGDHRAATDLQRRLTFVDGEVICLLEIRAAAELADPQLYPLLLRLRDEWTGDDDELTEEFTTELACAISRCRPEQKAQAATVERALLARVVTLLAEQPFTATLTGEYPRTVLTFQQIEHPSTPPVRAAIWPYEDPWDYSLDQQARDFVTPYAHGTET